MSSSCSLLSSHWVGVSTSKRTRSANSERDLKLPWDSSKFRKNFKKFKHLKTDWINKWTKSNQNPSRNLILPPSMKSILISKISLRKSERSLKMINSPPWCTNPRSPTSVLLKALLAIAKARYTTEISFLREMRVEFLLASTKWNRDPISCKTKETKASSFFVTTRSWLITFWLKSPKYKSNASVILSRIEQKCNNM